MQKKRVKLIFRSWRYVLIWNQRKRLFLCTNFYNKCSAICECAHEKLIICENLFVASKSPEQQLFIFSVILRVHPAGLILWWKSMKWIICLWWKWKWENLLFCLIFFFVYAVLSFHIQSYIACSHKFIGFCLACVDRKNICL